MKDFAIAKGAVPIYKSLGTRVALWLHCTREESNSVKLKEGFKQISAAMFKHALDLIIAGVVPETLVVEVCFVELDRRALVAQHVLLEGQETQVPGVTFLVGDEPGNGCWALHAGTESELPDAAINVSVAHEGSPVLNMLSLVRGQWHNPNIGDHVLIVDGGIGEI